MVWENEVVWTTLEGKPTLNRDYVRRIIGDHERVNTVNLDDLITDDFIKDDLSAEDLDFIEFIQDEVGRVCPTPPDITTIIEQIRKFQLLKSDVWHFLRDKLSEDEDNKNSIAFIIVRYLGVVMGMISFTIHSDPLHVASKPLLFPGFLPAKPEDIFSTYSAEHYASFIGITKTLTMWLSEKCGSKYPSLPSLIIPTIIKLGREAKCQWLVCYPLTVMLKILIQHYGFRPYIDFFYGRPDICDFKTDPLCYRKYSYDPEHVIYLGPPNNEYLSDEGVVFLRL